MVTFHFLCHDGIDTGNGRDIHDVTDRTFDVREVNRFVQSHLDRADYFRFTHVLDELVGGIG